jgi:hypothetical protein
MIPMRDRFPVSLTFVKGRCPVDGVLSEKLGNLGLTTEQIEKLKTEGVTAETDMALLSSDEIKAATGCGLLTAKKVAAAFAPAAATPPVAAVVPLDMEIPEGASPPPALVNSFAGQIGMSGDMLNMFLLTGALGAGGMGGDVDLSGMMSIPMVVQGYNPKRRDISYMVMGQLEKRMGNPIVVINEDGSVNKDATVAYVESLDEGFDASEDVYDDGEGNVLQIVAVGVDAQSVYDGDPLSLDKPLQKNSYLGVGRVSWKGVEIETRQAFRLALKTGEIDPTQESDMDWVRDHVKAGVSRYVLKGRAPKALVAFNEGKRTGELPMLRVTLTHGARKPRIMPNRRRLGDDRPRPTNRDRDRLAGVGKDNNGDEL